MSTSSDHIILRDNQFICRHCGASYAATLPSPVIEFARKGDAFIALHKNCKAPQETILAKRFDTEGMGRL